MPTAAQKRILLVCRKPPYGNTLAKDAIDIALATAAYDQDLHIVFIGDGVWQLHPNQNSEHIQSKNQQKLLSALPLYDINNLYVDAEALQQRNLGNCPLILDAKPLNSKALSALFDDADVILNF
jgi:tRNA 2-thiouridine synthesizing protein C